MLSEKLKDIDLSSAEHMCKKRRKVLKVGDIILLKDMVFEVTGVSGENETTVKRPVYILEFLEYTDFETKTKRLEI